MDHHSFFLLLLVLYFSPFALAQENVKNAMNVSANPCRQKWFPDAQSFVCVCSAEYCDEPELIGQIGKGQIVIFSSNPHKHRLHRRNARFEQISSKSASPPTVISVNPAHRFQTILGFGGAFTDSVGHNLNGLSWSTRENLLRAYFDPERGIGYSLGRVPIASTDFSTREYSYVDKERDFHLETFALAREDEEEKIPHIKMANGMSGGRLRLFGAPWSAPAWMKSNGRMSGEGQLKGDLDGPYYRAYAAYLKKFFDEYAKRGVHFWALTIQNQPESGLEEIPFQNMFLSNHSQREFAARLLVPLFRQSPNTANLKLIAFDDVREHLMSATMEIFAKAFAQPSGTLLGFILCPTLQNLAPSILPDFIIQTAQKWIGCQQEGEDIPENGADLISGIGVHWYTLEGHESQQEFHEMFPDKFILPTEACAGFLPEDQGPRMGNWTRGWMYGHDIVENIRNWAIGWMDWNLCLDMEGGPNWAKNFVDAPILVNAEKDEFYKQPMFYFLAHFSHFVPPGSVRIHSSLLIGPSPNQQQQEPQIDHVAFLTPNGQIVLVLINEPAGGESAMELAIEWAEEEEENKSQRKKSEEEDEQEEEEEEEGRKRGKKQQAKLVLEPGEIVTAIWGRDK